MEGKFKSILKRYQKKDTQNKFTLKFVNEEHHLKDEDINPFSLDCVDMGTRKSIKTLKFKDDVKFDFDVDESHGTYTDSPKKPKKKISSRTFGFKEMKGMILSKDLKNDMYDEDFDFLRKRPKSLNFVEDKEGELMRSSSIFEKLEDAYIISQQASIIN